MFSPGFLNNKTRFSTAVIEDSRPKMLSHTTLKKHLSTQKK